MSRTTSRLTCALLLGLSSLLIGCDEETGGELTAGECSDGRDNDGDGQADCDDRGCSTHAFCGAPDAGMDAGSTCPTGLSRCDGACVALDRDPSHCGSCGTECGAGEACDEGTCVISCPLGQLNCSGTCVDPDTDREHCGATADCEGPNAGDACEPGFVCDGSGSCALSCQAGMVECDGSCIDPDTDRRYCGAVDDCSGTSAGQPCEPGYVCDGSGSCALSCQAGLLQCEDRCIDPQQDPDHCGASGDCSGAAAGSICGEREVCDAGTCSCAAGLVRCGDECIDPNTDEGYCGATGSCAGSEAGTSCGDGEVCAAGTCSCAPGLVRCDGSCIDPSSDESYCGATAGCSGGTACGDGERCTLGSCECAPGLVRCGAECVDPETDETYCGAAAGCTGAVACGDGEACSAGACVCAPGLVRCGGSCIDPSSDRTYCGASGSCSGASAGSTCADGEICDGTGCATSCTSGLTECAGGCVDLSSSPTSCGDCGTSCPTPPGAWPVCVGGSCSFVCQPGQGDCNADPSDGCEVDLSTDASHCGACGATCPGTCSAGSCLCDSTLASADFESTSPGGRPSDWMDGCMSGTTYDWSVTPTAHTGSHGLMLDFRGGSGEAAVGIPVAWPTSGEVHISFWMRPETTTENIYVLPVRADQRLINAVPFQHTGNLGTGGSGVPYSSGTWYHVKYELDFDASTYRVRIDGSVYDSGSFASAGLPCTLSGADYLSMHGGYVDQKFLAYLDDLTITHYPPGCSP